MVWQPSKQSTPRQPLEFILTNLTILYTYILTTVWPTWWLLCTARAHLHNHLSWFTMMSLGSLPPFSNILHKCIPNPNTHIILIHSYYFLFSPTVYSKSYDYYPTKTNPNNIHIHILYTSIFIRVSYTHSSTTTWVHMISFPFQISFTIGFPTILYTSILTHQHNPIHSNPNKS